MSIAINTDCLICQLQKNVDNARKLGSEEQATAFATELMSLYEKAPKGVSSPWFGPQIDSLYGKYYGLDPDRFRQEKEDSNRFVLERIDKIRSRVEAAEDRILSGLQYAILGNYIDFSALHGQVSFEELETLLDKAQDMALDPGVYDRFRQDLSTAKRLLYITDNAGEIGFDRVCAEQIAREYPELAITFCVRGGPAQNDATREDAALVGVPFPVVDNGSTMAGTELSVMSQEARREFDRADVILSKGQGNVETLYGCGANIYYAFLVKCVRFQKIFNLPKLTPLLLRERDKTEK